MLNRFTRQTLKLQKTNTNQLANFFCTQIEPSSKSTEKESSLKTSPENNSTPLKYFNTYKLLHLTQPIAEVRKSLQIDMFKIFLHSATAFSLFFTPYQFIAPLFCWFASSSVIRLRAVKKQADQMVYRIDMSQDRQWIHFWTGIGKVQTLGANKNIKEVQEDDYTFRSRLEGGFDIVGTRIEEIEQEVRLNYDRYFSKKKLFLILFLTLF